MKFLCVLCDQPMKLIQVGPPDRGALSVLYECPECAHRIALLTNPFETQVVQSMGVQIGPSDEKPASKCPFSAMVSPSERAAGGPELTWTGAALERLEKVPEFVRPMARAGIERYARDRGLSEIDEHILERAREFFGM
ncbi:MAG: PCP reductase family protein [Candidatus Binatia bacterium]